MTSYLKLRESQKLPRNFFMEAKEAKEAKEAMEAKAKPSRTVALRKTM